MTKTGLKVKANLIKKVYKTGKKYAENYKEEMKIKFDEKLGKWNYRAVPLKAQKTLINRLEKQMSAGDKCLHWNQFWIIMIVFFAYFQANKKKE